MGFYLVLINFNNDMFLFMLYLYFVCFLGGLFKYVFGFWLMFVFRILFVERYVNLVVKYMILVIKIVIDGIIWW